MSEKDRYERIRKGMRRDNVLTLAVLMVLVILALIANWLSVNIMAVYTLIFAIAAIAGIGILRNLMVPEWTKNWSKYVMDERMRKTDAKAKSSAYALTSLIVVTIMLLALFKIVDIGTYPSMAIVLLAMYYSMFLFKWYYGRKGDAE